MENSGNNTVKYEYSIEYRKRKTIGITISLKGVEVRAPFGMSRSRVLEVIKRKSAWIEKKLKEMEKLCSEVYQKQYINGERFFYLGREYPLSIVAADGLKTEAAFFDDDKITVPVPEDNIKEIRGEYVREKLMHWYINAASELLNERTAYYSGRMNLKPSRVTLRGQKTRWGSCSSKGNISLNWRIIMAPMTVIDYVIIHELAHIRHMNHSKVFWSLVGNFMPEYNSCKKWLRNNACKMKFD